jgi:hypothetical protein
MRIKEKFKLFSDDLKKNFPQLRCKKYGLPRRRKGTKLKKCEAFSLMASRLSTTGGQVWLKSIFVKNSLPYFKIFLISSL